MENTFTALDFETAQVKRHSICQVGLVRYTNGKITDEINLLVQPPNNYYWPKFTDIHGITPEMTANAPTFDKIWPQIEPFITGQNVVAHNGLSFDFLYLTETLKLYNINIPDYNKFDTYRIYKKRLSILCDEYLIPLNHHDALSDSKACAQLFMLYLKDKINETVDEYAEKFNETPKFNMFNFLEKDDKELIHSQFLKFLITYYKKAFFKDFLNTEIQEGETETETSFTLKDKSRGRFDLIIKNENSISLVIENKFKSFPTNEQLEKYNNYFKEENISPICFLITFNKDIANVNVENWIKRDYSELLSFCKSLPLDESHKGIFIEHYIEFLEIYVSDFNELCQNEGLKTIRKKYSQNNFWESLAYYVIAAKIQKEIQKTDEDFYTSVFHGRQFFPGLNIFNKRNNKARFNYLNECSCWFEYQNNKFKIKFGKESVKFYNSLKDKALSDAPLYKSSYAPSEKDESFTLIQKDVIFQDIETVVNTIIEEFYNLKKLMSLN